MPVTSAVPQWIELEGAENVRDLGGLPVRGGGSVRGHRLIRADSLQELTAGDVALLVDTYGVRSVADLRSTVEVRTEGDGPMHRDPRVDVQHLSLLPEVGETTDAASAEAGAPDDAPVILPWQTRDARLTPAERRRGAAATYLRYLDDRGESIVAALRLVAHGDGATIVHCAAGKDRTGTVVALALDLVGVPRDEIAADYARSAERVEQVFARLGRRRTYAGDIGAKSSSPAEIDKHRPRAATIIRLLDGVDETYGGTEAWLRTQGWTDEDTTALRAVLLAR